MGALDLRVTTVSRHGPGQELTFPFCYFPSQSLYEVIRYPFFFFLQTYAKLRGLGFGVFVCCCWLGFVSMLGVFLSLPSGYTFSPHTARNLKELTSHTRSKMSHLFRRKYPRFFGQFRCSLLASDGIILKINKGSPGEWAKCEHLTALKDKELKAS